MVPEIVSRQVTDNNMLKEADVVILGAGMAGVSGALWCRRLDLSVILVDTSGHTGGALRNRKNLIPDYAGFMGTAPELADLLERQMDVWQVPLLPWRIDSVAPAIYEGVEQLRVGGHEGVIRARALLIATGAGVRKLGIAEKWSGEGLLYTASGHLNDFQGKRVAIVGGGDGAVENALNLAQVAGQVHLIVRRESFSARPGLSERIGNVGNVIVHFNATVARLLGHGRVTGVEYLQGGVLKRLECDELLVKIGFQPLSEVVSPLVSRNDAGYIKVDGEQRTSHPRIWAAGDVCTPVDPSLAVSAGQGAVAIRSIERFLRKSH